tara:strand:+ start:3374 stop:3505 length:132 start_codon:yes stop_codon:yes gene_type:complete
MAKGSSSVESAFNEGCGIKKSQKKKPPYPGKNPQKGVGKEYKP